MREEVLSNFFCECIIFMIFLPSANSDSLLPSRIVFPAFKAAKVGAMPAVPASTLIMISASLEVASLTKAWAEERAFAASKKFFVLNFLACFFNKSACIFAESPITRKCSGYFFKISKV